MIGLVIYESDSLDIGDDVMHVACGIDRVCGRLYSGHLRQR